MEPEAEMYKNTITSTGDNRRRVRNPEATCATCPYCKDDRICCRNAMTSTGNEFGITGPDNWCGEHPDFWKGD